MSTTCFPAQRTKSDRFSPLPPSIYSTTSISSPKPHLETSTRPSCASQMQDFRRMFRYALAHSIRERSNLISSHNPIFKGHVSTVWTGYTTVATSSDAQTLWSLEYRRPWARPDCYQMQVLPEARLQSAGRLEDKARQVSHESHLKSHPKSQRTLIQIRRLGNYSGPSTSKGTETFTSNKNRLPQMRFRTRR